MSDEKREEILGGYTHFGTDMATWKTNENGFTIINTGMIYGITEEQYNPDEGDITRSRAKAILSWS